MENSLLTPAAEDEQPKSVNQVVAGVLAEKTKKNLFLKNVGMQDAQTRSSVRTELEAERTTSELRSVVQTQCGQIDELSRKMKESEEARIRDRKEMNMKQAEMNFKLERLLSQSQLG